MDNTKTPQGKKEVFTPYITIKGKRIYRPNGGVFHFFADRDDQKRA